MRIWSEIRSRVDALMHRATRDRETDEEMAFHVHMQAGQLERAGLSRAEAMRRAHLAFGSGVDAREEVRTARGLGLLDDLSADLAYAFRQMRRSPGFAATVVATLALGIGASTAIYAVVDGVVLRPLPFVGSDRLVMVWETDRKSGTTREPASWPDIVDITERSRSLSTVAGLVATDMSLTSPDAPPIRLTGVVTTASFFDMTGIRPLVGRVFTASESAPGGPSVAVIGEALWRSRYAGSASVVGSTVRVDDVPYEIIGVLPAGVDFGITQITDRAAYHAPYSGEAEAGVWLPLQASEQQFPRDTHPFFLLGRLSPGATPATAQAELAGIAADLERQYPRANADRGVNVEPLTDVVFGPSRPLLRLLMYAVGLLLLVAFANVANLLLARGATRIREIAIRSAVGATARRVGRQLLVESLVLGVVGGMVGLLCARVVLRSLLALAPKNIPRLQDIAVDGRLMALAVIGSLGVGIAFGIVPMWQARRVDVVHALKGEATPAGGRRRRSAREILVIAAVALSVTLTIGASMLGRSFRNLMEADAGFRAANVVKAEFQLPGTRYPQDRSRWPNFTEILNFDAAVIARARAIPGVQAAALAGAHPLDPGFTNSWQIVGREEESRRFPEISVRVVSPEYLETVGGTLLRGRALSASDDGRAPAVAMINETTARRFFPTSEPIGASIRFWGISRLIVGVVRDERIHGLREAAPPSIYAPIAQIPPSSGVLLVRTSRNPEAVGVELQRAIWSIDPQLAVYGVEPLTRTVLRSVASSRFAMLVLSVFSAVTVLLALIGVHGVVSYLVRQRTREIGIRVALGAKRGTVAALVVRTGVVLGSLGVAIGVAGAWALTRLLTSLMYGVDRFDPASFIAVALGMLTAAALSAYVPARRAARVSPLLAIRVD